MSIFGNLMDKIRGHSARAQEAKVNEANAVSNQTFTPAPAAAAAVAPVDIEAVMTDLASKSKQTLDWKHSIVDLMKLAGMESSLTERKALATELGYTGDMNDSATMNTWLHKEVLKKMSENGGTVPASMLD